MCNLLNQKQLLSTKEEKYWFQRYQEKNTGWNIGYPSTPLKTYIDQLEDIKQTKNLAYVIKGNQVLDKKELSALLNSAINLN